MINIVIKKKLIPRVYVFLYETIPLLRWTEKDKYYLPLLVTIAMYFDDILFNGDNFDRIWDLFPTSALTKYVKDQCVIMKNTDFKKHMHTNPGSIVYLKQFGYILTLLNLTIDLQFTEIDNRMEGIKNK